MCYLFGRNCRFVTSFQLRFKLANQIVNFDTKFPTSNRLNFAIWLSEEKQNMFWLLNPMILKETSCGRNIPVILSVAAQIGKLCIEINNLIS